MTLSLEGLKVGAAYPNVTAFLRVIRERESGQGADAYLMINGGGHMDGFAKHPWENVPTTKGARACGAYQFLGTTWGGLCRQYEFPDFGPESQDLGAIALIQERGALQDVIAGRFEEAVAKLLRSPAIWTSLPGGPESSAKWTMDKARAVFINYGGKLDNDELLQPAAPVEDHSPTNLPPAQQPETPMPDESPFDWSAVAKTAGAVASFFNPIVGAAITALSPLLQQKIEATVARHSDPATAKVVATNISDVIGKVVQRETGLSDPFQAVVAMQKSPEVIAKVEAAVVDRLEQMAPFLDKLHQQSKDEWDATEKSMDNAVERTNASAIGALVQKTVMFFAEGLVLLAMVFTGALIAYQMYRNGGAEPSGQLMILFAMLVTMSANTVRTIADWAFGSSKNSAAKDLTLNEFAARRAK
jgi:muramidase (phage lysozyme)